jgi:sulfur carrier protein ThiS
MQITIKLGGPLRKRISGHQQGELSLELAEGSKVSDALIELGLDGDVVRVLMLNGRPIAHDKVLKENDRLALFPRELAFNVCTAISFFNPLVREAHTKKS